MISDLAARQQALNPEQSFIVQAPAGSGKTGLLVYRYLTLLARVDTPQNVLAITFTRKARAEMRDRIIELMMSAQQGQQSQDAFEQQGIELAQQVLQRDKHAGWRLLDAPHQMQILTIDAFSARLAASMPWLSRLGDRPNTTDSAEAHYAYAVDQVLDELLNPSGELSSSLQTVMHELDFNYDKARRLFSSMLAKRDQWLRHLVQQDIQSLRVDLEAAWQNLIDESISGLRTMLADGMLEKLLVLGTEAAQRIDYDSPRAAKKMQALTQFNGDLDSLKLVHWQALVELLMVKTGDKIRTALDKNTGFPAGHRDKAKAKELLDHLRDDSELIIALSEFSRLPVPSFQDSDWQCLLALEQVLKALAVYLQLRFRAVGECDHSEVTQRANIALAELNNPTDLGLLMDGQIHHILVDEFQDTSNGQISLLKQLTSGWQSHESPTKTLFLVGDPMQSIYRFREADVSLFLQVANNADTQIFENLAIQSLTLSQNFRSSETLVNWFNSTFSQSFPAQDAVLTGAIRYSSAQSSKQSDGAEPVLYRLANERDQEAQALLETVEQALLDLPDEHSQIAILVRSRSHLDYLLPTLDQHGIDYAAVDIQPLHEQQAIKDVVSLCQAICRKDDRLAWLALLRGPWCGLTLNEIHNFAARRNSSGRYAGSTIWQQLNDPKKQQALKPDSLQRLQRFIGIMRATLQQYQQVDLGSLTRWAWLQLGGMSSLGSTQYEDIQQLFQVLNHIQRGGDLPNQKELQQALVKMRASHVQRKRPRVVVSTIHKSKGLQYHTVILPGLANKGKSDDREILMWAEHQGQYGNTNLLLAPLLFSAPKGSHYDYLRSLDSTRAQNEVMRLMYVACTRAEKHLVLIGSAKISASTGELHKPASSSLLASVWAPLESQFELLPESIKNEDVSTQLDQTLRRLPAEFNINLGLDFAWQPQDQLNAPSGSDGLDEPEDDTQDSDTEVVFDWATQVATGVGIILHDFLQYHGRDILTINVGDELKQRWRVELLALQVPDNRIEYAVRRLATAIINIQQDTQAHFIFNDYAIEQNEYAVSSLEAGVVNAYRLDRTFVDEHNVRWVVDYKSTTTRTEDVAAFVDEQVAERHRAQLDKYGSLMSKIDTRAIKLAVYFPLLKQLRIWDYQPEMV